MEGHHYVARMGVRYIKAMTGSAAKKRYAAVTRLNCVF